MKHISYKSKLCAYITYKIKIIGGYFVPMIVDTVILYK